MIRRMHLQYRQRRLQRIARNGITSIKRQRFYRHLSYFACCVSVPLERASEKNGAYVIRYRNRHFMMAEGRPPAP